MLRLQGLKTIATIDVTLLNFLHTVLFLHCEQYT